MTPPDPALKAEFDAAKKIIDRILGEISETVVGQKQLQRRLITALITDGHILLEAFLEMFILNTILRPFLLTPELRFSEMQKHYLKTLK